jgi:hypothetical protein
MRKVPSISGYAYAMCVMPCRMPNEILGEGYRLRIILFILMQSQGW